MTYKQLSFIPSWFLEVCSVREQDQDYCWDSTKFVGDMSTISEKVHSLVPEGYDLVEFTVTSLDHTDPALEQQETVEYRNIADRTRMYRY